MHPTENILKVSMSELKEMIDVNTIVGSPFVSPGGCTIIPISRLSFGFVSGGAEYGVPAQTREESRFQFGGGTASGVSITPVAFMVADETEIKLLTVAERSALDKVMENIPRMAAELKDMLGGKCRKKDNEPEGDDADENADE